MAGRAKDRRKNRNPGNDTEIVRESKGTERRVGERRTTGRIEVEMWVEQERDREWALRRSADLSRGGMRLNHGVPYPVGTRATLRFSLPGDTHVFNVQAEVVEAQWEAEGPRSSVRFLSLTDDEQARIAAYVEKIGG